MDDDGFEQSLDALEARFGESEALVSQFTRELGALEGQVLRTSGGIEGLSRSFGGSLKRAFDGVALDGMKLSDSLSRLASSMVNSAYNAAMKPVTGAVGGLLSNGLQAVLPFADGAPFAQGRVMPFATGGVVSGPVTFPMRGATGLMGEAGPEAIMPLRRGPDGKLGVAAPGGGRGNVHVTMNIQTQDVAGFRKSRSQVAAEMQRALARGSRNH
jgi:phage-related minor tail protein